MFDKADPDPETRVRIKNLALVGIALNTFSSDVSFQTDFDLALEALNKFKEGIDKLNLDDESSRGMQVLIEYLRKKIEKRKLASVKDMKM